MNQTILSLIVILICSLNILSSCSNNNQADCEASLETTDTVATKTDTAERFKYRIYLSADLSITKEAGISIEQGIKTALAENRNNINGFHIELVSLNHRGNNKRAKKHLEQYLLDSMALVLFSGLHSPPLLTARDFINVNRILVLDPWAAAGSITRSETEENWIFRLSIDDNKAGKFISDYAVNTGGFKKPFLLLEHTGWGRSNQKTMTAALKQKGIKPSGVAWFNWNLGKSQAKALLRDAKASGADVIFFVGNAPEGKLFAKAMSQLDTIERLPIRSHWGITGGDFPKVITREIREKIDLKFIQTKYSFLNIKKGDLGEQVFNKASTLFPTQIKNMKDIKAPAGFIHAYDLTKIFIAASKQAELKGEVLTDRLNLKVALENLDIQIEGLIKNYNQPFSPYNSFLPDAHEALSAEDYCMAKYGDNGEILLLK